MNEIEHDCNEDTQDMLEEMIFEKAAIRIALQTIVAYLDSETPNARKTIRASLRNSARVAAETHPDLTAILQELAMEI